MRPERSSLDPIARLIDDHRNFVRTVESFQQEARSSLRGPATSVRFVAQVARFAEFLKRDVDRVHGQKEERGLFPVLGRYLPAEGGPVGVMLNEHETLRQLQRTLDSEGQRLERDPLAQESIRSVSATADAVEGLLGVHIEKEDTVLFPMAYQVLSPRDLQEIAQVFDEIDSADLR